MFIPIWVIILAWLIVPALCYAFGAIMANTKTKREIIQEMTKAEAVDMLAKVVTEKLKKKLAAAVTGRIEQKIKDITAECADELNCAELVFALEEEFKIELSDEDMKAIKTMGQLIEIVTVKVISKGGITSPPEGSKT